MPEIKLTDRAISEVKQVMAEQGFDPAEYVLEVGVIGGGCSGFTFKMQFREKTEVDEKLFVPFNFGGVDTVVGKKAILYLDGTTVDFHEDLNKRGFTFDNPQSTGKCGCGSSFSI